MVDRLPRMLGADTEVACVDGRTLRYANLDHAASTPVMEDVWAAVEEFVPWYSSVHRGSGYKSQRATAEYEDAREAVARFVGARPDDRVVFVRNTTEAINVLAASLPPGTRVLSSRVEHHANMLPWRRHDVRLLPFTDSPGELLDATERALRAERIDLVAVTGASNVTGEVWPVAELAELAHDHGAALFVDAAQLAPHRLIDMTRAGIDLLAFSGHKLYAPFGAGALVGPAGRRRAAAGGRRRDPARHRRRRDLGRRARPLRGGLAERRRRGGAGGRVPQPARARDGRGRGARAVAGRPAVDAAGDGAGAGALDPVAGRDRRPRRRRHLQPRRLPRSARSPRS